MAGGEVAENTEVEKLYLDTNGDEQPHAWILRSLEKIVVASCEEMIS